MLRDLYPNASLHHQFGTLRGRCGSLEVSIVIQGHPAQRKIWIRSFIGSAHMQQDRTKMFRLTASALALSLLSPTHAHNLEHIAISGWYPSCNLEADALNETCSGDFVLSDEPAELDKTGNTCYVNPLQENITDIASVFWLGSLNNVNGTYLYSNLLLDENVTKYKPTNCSSNGACDCGPFDDLRGEDWAETGECGGGCTIVPAEHLDHLKGEECAILVTFNTTNAAGDIVGMCPILGKLIDVIHTLPTATSNAFKLSLFASFAAFAAAGIVALV
jgi:hypothetical protein